MLASQTALIIGATGQTGRHLLQSLLESPRYTRVAEYGRHLTPKDSIKTGLNKLEQKVIDFDNLPEAKLPEGKWDVVFITYASSCTAVICSVVEFFSIAWGQLGPTPEVLKLSKKSTKSTLFLVMFSTSLNYVVWF